MAWELSCRQYAELTEDNVLTEEVRIAVVLPRAPTSVQGYLQLQSENYKGKLRAVPARGAELPGRPTHLGWLTYNSPTFFSEDQQAPRP